VLGPAQPPTLAYCLLSNSNKPKDMKTTKLPTTPPFGITPEFFSQKRMYSRIA